MLWDVEKFKNKTAIIDDARQEVSYDDLIQFSYILNSKVQKRGLIFVLCDNNIGSVLGYYGMIQNEIIPLMLRQDLSTDLLFYLYNVYKPAYIWGSENVVSLLVNDFLKGQIIHKQFGYVLIEVIEYKYLSIDKNLALLLTTSGSTGSPKLVRQSYRNILANTKSIIEYLHITESDRAITMLPMNYTYGLSIINTHLMAGATILLTDKSIMQKEFWQFFKEQGATSIAGVPYTYEMLDKLRFYRMDLPSLKTMTQAGGKLTPELHEKFAKYAEETGKKFVVMYGQCEATARMGYLPPEKAVEKKGSMGIAIPGGKFKLVDEEGEEITAPHTTGELIYEGENVTLGYAECVEDLAKGDERHGVLATGDMAQFDEDGYYYIVGRKKRFLKIYGNRVNLDEVERLIKGEFDIDVASGGIDDHLYVFVTADSYSSEVKDFIVDKTKLNPAAYKVVVVPEIPRNGSGKTLYKDLEKYYV